jgi:HK97 gp10 family phage protein
VAVKIFGADSLKKKLRKLPQETRTTIRAAIEQSASELVEMQKRLAPKKTGALRDSIVATMGDGSTPKYAAFQKRGGGKRRSSSVAGDPDLSVRVTAGNSAVRYAHLVEFGTEPHEIKAKRAKALGKDGQFGTKVEHPGASAHPYFFPAYRALKKRMKSRISRATNKAAKAVAQGK